MIKKIFFIFCISFTCHNLAHANYIIMDTGYATFKVAPFPNQISNSDPVLAEALVGYRCQHFALFWADFAIWDCALVGINYTNDGHYFELSKKVRTQLESRPEYQKDKIQRTFWNRYGMYVLIICMIGFIFITNQNPSSSTK